MFDFDLTYFTKALIKLSLSSVCSFIIGVEREFHSHPGGVCTHTLVGLGSCLFTMISVTVREKYDSPNADPARICAQIVSGMGFLGSATIFKNDNYVKGINTAANLWISAAISMAIGMELFEFAFTTTIVTFIILGLNNRYKRCVYKKRRLEQEKKDNENGGPTNVELAVLEQGYESDD
jgi:putative Mg2+ transporter-C (MgtC) family protein